MNQPLKKILWGIFAVVLLVVCGVWFLTDDMEHIEDTNGADNFSLQTITDENIINKDMGMIGGISVKQNMLSASVTISAENFTGVYDVLYNNYIGKSDFLLNLTGLTVTKGNFKAVIIHNDKIVDVLEFNSEDPFTDYLLEDIDGSVYLRIAGESAAFEFSMLKIDYDAFEH